MVDFKDSSLDLFVVIAPYDPVVTGSSEYILFNEGRFSNSKNCIIYGPFHYVLALLNRDKRYLRHLIIIILLLFI
jgi:hypothetical protein